MAQKKKKEKKKFRIPKWTFMVIWMPIAIVALYFGYVYLFITPTFMLTQIEINGNHQVSNEEVCKRAEIKEGDNLLILSLSGIWQKLSYHPWVKEVEIRRLLPHRLIINITERTPLYAVPGPSGTVLAMDEEGYILPALPSWYMPEEFSAFGITHMKRSPKSNLYPLLKGLSDIEIGKRISVSGIDNLILITKLTFSEDPNIFMNLKSAEIGKGGEITLDFHKYLGKVEFGTQFIKKRTDRLCKTWKFLNDENVECSMVDLRFDRQGVTIKPVEIKKDIWDRISKKYKSLHDTKLSMGEDKDG